MNALVTSSGESFDAPAAMFAGQPITPPSTCVVALRVARPADLPARSMVTVAPTAPFAATHGPVRRPGPRALGAVATAVRSQGGQHRHRRHDLGRRWPTWPRGHRRPICSACSSARRRGRHNDNWTTSTRKHALRISSKTFPRRALTNARAALDCYHGTRRHAVPRFRRVSTNAAEVQRFGIDTAHVGFWDLGRRPHSLVPRSGCR